MSKCIHKDLVCYVGWCERPFGTGEAAVIVIPLGEDRLSDNQLTEIMKPLKVTSFSQETIDFRIQELDSEKHKHP